MPRQFYRIFNNRYRNNWISTGQRTKSDPTSVPYTKINSKWIIDLNVKAKTIKLLDEHIGINLYDFGLDNSFVNTALKIQTAKEKIDKLNFIQIKRVSKNTIKKMKR